MQALKSLGELTYRSNIEVYRYNEKYIIVYDDHRYILNVLFEAFKLGMFDCCPNIIYFDRHDDACNPQIKKSELLKRWGVTELKDVSSPNFWSFVEFDLGYLDDDWLLAGMELGLINNSVVIGQQDNSNIRALNNRFVSTDGKTHELYSISHLNTSLGCRGCLGDNVIKEPYYTAVRNIFEYNQPPYGRDNKFSKEATTPFILDFDLDCFTTECEEKIYAWPETIFRRMYYEHNEVQFFMREIISRCQFITICREPECCGGIGESNKILEYLDQYLFEGNLGTIPII